MNRLLSAKAFLQGLPLISLLALTGCVTASDLEKLNKGLTEQLQAMEARTQSQAGDLRTELEAIHTAPHMPRNDLAEVRTDTKAAVEVVRQGEATRSRMQEELKAEINQNTRALTKYAGENAEALQRIADFTDRVSTQVHDFQRGVTQIVVGRIRADEAALRERLKSLVETREQLESVAGRMQVETPGPSELPEEGMLVEQAQANE